MPGGLIQLVACGIQDMYLSGDPQITFFKIVYRRHTNFAIESVVQNFSSMANFGETVSCPISRVGDLVGRIFLYVEIPSIPKFVNENGEPNALRKMAWAKNLGYALVKEVSIEIGGKQIDKQYGEWMYIWSQVSHKQGSVDKMVGNIPALNHFTNGKDGYRLYIPLEFWFCRNTGLSIPLVSLTASDLRIVVTFRRLEECWIIGPTHCIEMAPDIVEMDAGSYIEQTSNLGTIYGYVTNYDYLTKRLYYNKIHNQNALKRTFESTHPIYNTLSGYHCMPNPSSTETTNPISIPYKPHIVNSFLYVDYVYLDNEERNKFSKQNHEYLIEQIQFNQELNVSNCHVKQNLTLNHPCKAHYWVVQLDRMTGPASMNDWFNYTSSHTPNSPDIMSSAKMVLNGIDRASERGPAYYNLVEPLEHHSRGPSAGIYVYSFGLKPEQHQPSSTINMSKIDQINMEMKLGRISGQNTCSIRSYTINYNVLRIFFNMGGLAFDWAGG